MRLHLRRVERTQESKTVAEASLGTRRERGRARWSWGRCSGRPFHLPRFSVAPHINLHGGRRETATPRRAWAARPGVPLPSPRHTARLPAMPCHSIHGMHSVQAGGCLTPAFAPDDEAQQRGSLALAGQSRLGAPLTPLTPPNDPPPQLSLPGSPSHSRPHQHHRGQPHPSSMPAEQSAAQVADPGILARDLALHIIPDTPLPFAACFFCSSCPSQVEAAGRDQLPCACPGHLSWRSTLWPPWLAVRKGHYRRPMTVTIAVLPALTSCSLHAGREDTQVRLDPLANKQSLL